MTIENALRSIAGFFVIVSLTLAHYVSPLWTLFAVFVGLNLLQAGFSNWCPMMWVLEKLGLQHEREPESSNNQGELS